MALEFTTEYLNGIPISTSSRRIPDEPLEFTYCWLHIPTGKTGTSSAPFMNRSDLLEALNKWNKDHRWKYWEP